MSTRQERLANLSKVIIDDQIVQKLDTIAMVNINGRHDFNIYRRYNSPYNIVIEDYNDDIHLYGNYTVRSTLQNLMCLSPTTVDNLYTFSATAFRNNGPIYQEPLDMTWLEIQEHYEGASIDIWGNFNSQYDEPPATPPNQHILPALPNAPARPATPPSPSFSSHLSVPLAPALYLLELAAATPLQNPADAPDMSMRNQDVKRRQRLHHPPCYCHDEEDTESISASDDDQNYTVLRSGTMIRKA
jgi:hypothetical protein